MSKSLKFLSVAILVIAIGGSYYFPQIQNVIGANPGPDSSNECTTQNGVQTCKYRKAFVTATTTPCAIKSPSATSTLVRFQYQVNVATATAVTFHAATSTTDYATTTVFQTDLLASANLGTFNFSPTSTVNQVTPPNTRLVLGAMGFLPADTSKLKGTCQADFVVN